jgi:hypothetical protein
VVGSLCKSWRRTFPINLSRARATPNVSLRNKEHAVACVRRASPQGRVPQDGTRDIGIYTQALLEWLSGKVDLQHHGLIEVAASRRLHRPGAPELTAAAGRAQHLMRSSVGQTFPIVRRPRPGAPERRMRYYRGSFIVQ